MAKESSFDVVSEFDYQEMVNAVDQAKRELNTRFDLKDTGSDIELEKEQIVLKTTDAFRLQNIQTILEEKMIKRSLSPHILDPKPVEEALGGKVRQVFVLKKGIEKELAKEISNQVKASKLKVQASIQGDQVRITGKDKDELQQIIKLLKEHGERVNVPLQFTNYR